MTSSLGIPEVAYRRTRQDFGLGHILVKVLVLINCIIYIFVLKVHYLVNHAFYVTHNDETKDR